MKISEVTFAEQNASIKPNKPPTPEQSRIAALQTAKDRASQVLQAERKRQKVAKAQKAMSAALKPVVSF
tara:strand:+ start:661 stop:867 length:207 start_codon:yes stop_codon:yes gene_type:complete